MNRNITGLLTEARERAERCRYNAALRELRRLRDRARDDAEAAALQELVWALGECRDEAEIRLSQRDAVVR